jgi:uncharacterized protein with HEPN domain
MLDAARSAQEFAAGRSRGDLENHKMLLFAVVRAIEIVGEAASRISAETRLATPSIPWAEIVAMRNRLIHAYFDVDHDILWKTVTIEIPDLAALLANFVDST